MELLVTNWSGERFNMKSGEVIGIVIQVTRVVKKQKQTRNHTKIDLQLY